MKRVIICLYAIAISLATSFNATAYKFEVDGIYYNIISSTDFTCAVAPLNGNDNMSPDGGLIEKAPYNKDAYKGVITISEKVKYNLKEYTVTSIDYRAFINCSELTEVKMPGTIKTINEDAFFGCSNLQKLIIPKSVSKIISYIKTLKAVGKEVYTTYTSCFDGCYNLTELSVEECNDYYKSDSNNSLIIGKPYYREYYYPYFSYDTGTTDDINSNNSVILVANVPSIAIPEGSTSLSICAFSCCSNLNEMTFPGTISSISTETLTECKNLTTIRLNKSTTTFSFPSEIPTGCKIKELYLDRTITNSNIKFSRLEYLEIGPNSIQLGNFSSTNIKQIDCYPLINIKEDTFTPSIFSKTTLRIPIGSANAFKSHSVWGKFENIVEELNLEDYTHDLNLDQFVFNSNDSTCTLVTTNGLSVHNYTNGGNKTENINRKYQDSVHGYKLTGIGDGKNPLYNTISISLPASIQHINDYSLSKIYGKSTSLVFAKEYTIEIPVENDLRYIGAYAFPANPFDRFRLHINKVCKVHEYAFATKGSIIQYLSNLTIDPENPYIGIDGGVIFFKGNQNVVRYFIHENENTPAIIPLGFSHIENISTTTTPENILFEDGRDISYLRLTNCNISSKNDVLSFNNIDTITNKLFSNCTFDIKHISFPNAKYVQEAFDGTFSHLQFANVETLETEKLFIGTADTLSVYVNQLLGNKLFAGATIRRLNWLNNDVPFAESMEDYAKRIDVLNLGNAKAVGIRGLMYSLKNRNCESLILLSTPTPPEVLSIVLFDDYPSKVKLYVPAGSGDTYRNHDKWCVIPNIIEYDVNGPDPTSGTNNITSHTPLLVDVYTLQGTPVRKRIPLNQATQGLTQGIYIINRQKILVK